MSDEVKVPVVPETTVEAPLIVNPREAIENQVITENNTFPEAPIEESTDSKPTDESAEPKPESTEATDTISKIKASVQKRIDKVVAKQKTAEERVAELEAENARLRATSTANTPTPKDDTPPTLEQVEAYILKMREEGNAKEEIAATRYLIKLEKEEAIKAVKSEQSQVQIEAQAKAARESAALLDLAKDYIVYDSKGEVDMKSDLTLANQKGKLFQTAMALYNDPELNKTFYNDPDRALGFRRAVQDAKRELHAQGLIKTPKAETLEIRRPTERVALADPESTETEETTTQTNTLPSDAEKVRAEILQRQRLRTRR